MSYRKSWQINPTQKPDLHYDDWHEGFRNACDRIYPKYPTNRAYMMGWLNALGMQAGYENQLPTVNDESYLEGYEDAQFERSCHYPNDPDIREMTNYAGCC